MARRSDLECVDNILKGLTTNNSPLGGNIFLGIGDLCQEDQVVCYGGKSKTMDTSIVLCPLWH